MLGRHLERIFIDFPYYTSETQTPDGTCRSFSNISLDALKTQFLWWTDEEVKLRNKRVQYLVSSMTTRHCLSESRLLPDGNGSQHAMSTLWLNLLNEPTTRL